MKVGDYVRTKDGYICKIEDGEEFYEDSVDIGIGIIPDVDGIWIDKAHFQYVDKRDIVKISDKPIDLIEVGDYVNGEKVTKVVLDSIECNYIELDYSYNKHSIRNKDIKSIVTKEQFSQMEYKVGE